MKKVCDKDFLYYLGSGEHLLKINMRILVFEVCILHCDPNGSTSSPEEILIYPVVQEHTAEMSKYVRKIDIWKHVFSSVPKNAASLETKEFQKTRSPTSKLYE